MPDISNPITWTFPDEISLKSIDLNDKDKVVELLSKTMLLRTSTMFTWKNLPDTIPEELLEMQIQTQGYTSIVEHNGKYFACWGSAGGYNNYNYQPTRFIVSNPYLFNGSKIFKIYYCKEDYTNPVFDTTPYDGECVVVYNDTMCMGVLPLNTFYGSQLADNIQTKRLVTILSRAMNVFVADDDDDKKNFDDFVNDLVLGKYKAVCSKSIIEKIKNLPLSEKGHEALTNLIEDQQYIKASWYNDLGLQANYNMKRESINSNESQLNKDAVLPLPDNMLRARKLACKRINELFGLNIDVEFNSAWGYTRQTIEQAIEAIDKENANTGDALDGDIENTPNHLGAENETEEPKRLGGDDNDS